MPSSHRLLTPRKLLIVVPLLSAALLAALAAAGPGSIGLSWTAKAVWASDGSLWTDSGPLSNLYTDIKARQVGDLITILVMEQATASDKVQTTSSNEAGASVAKGIGLLSFLPEVGVGANSGFTGSETTSRQGSLVARITARVVEVLPNGDLRIEGTRSVLINNQKQEMVIRGTVRVRDISADNTVLSSSVSDAEISFKGVPGLEGKSGGFFSNLWDGIVYFFGRLF